MTELFLFTTIGCLSVAISYILKCGDLTVKLSAAKTKKDAVDFDGDMYKGMYRNADQQHRYYMARCQALEREVRKGATINNRETDNEEVIRLRTTVRKLKERINYNENKK